MVEEAKTARVPVERPFNKENTRKRRQQISSGQKRELPWGFQDQDENTIADEYQIQKHVCFDRKLFFPVDKQNKKSGIPCKAQSMGSRRTDARNDRRQKKSRPCDKENAVFNCNIPSYCFIHLLLFNT